MADIGRRALIAGMAGVTLATPASAAPAVIKVGERAPTFSLISFDHHEIKFAALGGKVVVLNFWATWCAPCRNEMLVMDAYARTHPNPDLKIFAVATEDSVPENKLRPLAASLSFPLAAKIWGKAYATINGSVPTSYVIDRTGMVRHAAAGAFTAESFDALITPLLANNGAA